MQRQLAIKVIVILIIGAVILIPITMVKSKVYERQNYLEHAKHSVAQSWTGRQLLFTPIIVIPYHLSLSKRSTQETGFYVKEQTTSSDRYQLVLPTDITTNIEVANKSVFKGIYEIPIYNSEINISGEFSSTELDKAVRKIKSMAGFQSIEKPYISIYISDVRGVDKIPQLVLNQKNILLNSGSQLPSLTSGLHSILSKSIGELDNKNLEFTFDLSLRGMDGLSFIPFADNATTRMSSDWPHPEFTGMSLPIDRNISSDGFEATWSSTLYSNNSAELLKQCIETSNCHDLPISSSGVDFIEPVDIYLQSERSIKYAMLFIGLSFITFFIFEHIKNIRIHPIQYAFVGLATAVFYLLLISLAEHIAFHWAYLISVSACASLLLFYVKYMLKRFSSALLFSLIITLLYGLLYVIVQAEDFALLMGSLLVFTVLSTLMVITRKIDWYNLSTTEPELKP